MNLKQCVGETEKVNKVVSEKDTALIVASGDLEVFSTPGMIAMMENASMSLVKDHLEIGCSTVGVKIDIKHISATPIGFEVWAESQLVEVDGRRLLFHVKAWDEKGIIGEGTHERFIVNKDSFLAKTNKK